MNYILASGSPRRQELLKQIGMEFTVITADVDESYPYDTEPERIVERLSRRKCGAVYDKIRDKLSEQTVIIAADTIVFSEARVLGKPHSEEEAFEMLKSLSGKSHFVYTGVTLIFYGEKGLKDITFSDKAEVFFRELSDEEIWAYISTGEPADKAGAYGIQGRGAVLVEKIIGDFYTIVGLPLVRVASGIKELTRSF